MKLGDAGLPAAVLFACSRNAVRSPMAAAILRRIAGNRVYVQSAGVHPGETDPFAVSVMDEIGIDMSHHQPVALQDLHDTSFDLVVSLAPDAYRQVRSLPGRFNIDVEYWPTPDATLASGSREQILSAYRAVRDGLFERIKDRFRLTSATAV